MFPQVRSVWDMIISYITWLTSDQQTTPSCSLTERMKKYTNQQHDVYCHPFQPHIVSLKSSMLSRVINTVTSIEEKKAFYDKFNATLQQVVAAMYDRFDPHLVYAFNNEIHLVFYPNEEGQYLYDGRISKIITTIASWTSVEMTKRMGGEDGSFIFEANFVEFARDWEVLNYILWRQYDCKRNSMTLLYKCLNKDLVEDGQDPTCFVKLDEMAWELLDQEISDAIVYGSTMKKELDSVTFRKRLTTSHQNWHMFEFKEILQTYIINKYLYFEDDEDDENDEVCEQFVGN